MKSSIVRFPQVGPNIVYARKAAGMTQLDLANQLGITTRALQLWEGGQTLPSARNLKQLARIFGRDTTWFYTRHDDLELAA